MNAASIAATAREHRGLSRKQLAAAAGTTTTTITRIETGSSDATIEMARRLTASVGLHLEFVLRQVPTLAAASSINADSFDAEPLLRMRVAAELALREPALAAAIIGPAPQTDDSWALNVLAGIAEHIANRTGIEPPRWASEIRPLDEPWHPDSTPAMVARSAATATPELAARNVFLGADSIWSTA